MKRKLLRKKLNHYIKITAILFLSCLIISSAYSVIIYNITLKDMRLNAADCAADFYNAANDYGLAYAAYLFSDENTELRVTDYSRNTIFQTGGYIAVDFTTDKGWLQFGIIISDRLRNSMTDSQYKKIRAYLKSKPDKELYKSGEEPRYELSCREFYVDKLGFIIPKRLEIVATEETNTWYAQDKVEQSFSLNVKKPKGAKLYRGGDMDRNTIAADFILADNAEPEFLDIAIESATNPDDPEHELKTDMFTYVYFSHNRIYLSNPKYSYDIYNTYFAQRYNPMDACGDEILTAFLVLMGFFLLLGLVLGYVSWKTVRTQINEEEKRRNMTNAMAHDLKTPLFVISGYAENLKDSTDRDKQEYYADVILKQTDKMDSIIHNMLDLSKLDSADFTIHRESFCLNDIVTDMLKNYPEGRLSFVEDSPLQINADRELIAEALHNIVDNGVKYCVADTPVAIKINSGRFEISNTVSQEISKEDLEKIWQPYTKLDPSRNTKGNGLGLAIAKRIFQLHNYSFGCECKDNTVTFWFEVNTKLR